MNIINEWNRHEDPYEFIRAVNKTAQKKSFLKGKIPKELRRGQTPLEVAAFNPKYRELAEREIDRAYKIIHQYIDDNMNLFTGKFSNSKRRKNLHETIEKLIDRISYIDNYMGCPDSRIKDLYFLAKKLEGPGVKIEPQNESRDRTSITTPRPFQPSSTEQIREARKKIYEINKGLIDSNPDPNIEFKDKLPNLFNENPERTFIVWEISTGTFAIATKNLKIRQFYANDLLVELKARDIVQKLQFKLNNPDKLEINLENHKELLKLNPDQIIAWEDNNTRTFTLAFGEMGKSLIDAEDLPTKLNVLVQIIKRNKL